MRPVDVIAKYAGVEIGVLLRARDKHAAEIKAVLLDGISLHRVRLGGCR